MSMKALAWAASSPVNGAAQHVLLGLANFHNKDDGRCNPSTAQLVEWSGLSERTVRRALAELISSGLVVQENANPETGRAKGGRRVTARYAFVVRLETRPDRPPFANARVVVTRPEGPASDTETRPNRTPGEGETRPNVSGNPATVTPLSLRDKPGYEPGSTSDAAASAQNDGLFEEPPAAKPSRALAVAGRKEIAALNAGDAVAAWVDAYEASHDAKPTTRQIGQVGRESRQLLEAGNPPQRVVAAATAAGERGLPMVERQYRDMASRRPGGAAAARPSTTDARVAKADDLARYYEAIGQ